MHKVRREYHTKYIRLLPVLGNTDVQYFTELQYHKKANVKRLQGVLFEKDEEEIASF